MKFMHRNYTTSFTVCKPNPTYENLNWLQRVILRRKPRVIGELNQATCKALADMARKTEEALINDIFNNGKK